MAVKKSIAILDFGSQYTRLIARKIRELNVYSLVFPYDVDISILRENNVVGVIFSGGPDSVYCEDSVGDISSIVEMGFPILGICYGMHLIARYFGAEVMRFDKQEYGSAVLNVENAHGIFDGLPSSFRVWMSHGDSVVSLPDSFEAVAFTDDTKYAAIAKDDIIGIQFHPEVAHGEYGKHILSNFIFKICKISQNWKCDSLLDEIITEIRQKVAKASVLCALSGGVDSAVVALLLQKAIGNRLKCVFVDNGLLRYREREIVIQAFRDAFSIELYVIDAAEIFLKKLEDIVDPEQKRKIIGREFIYIFEKFAKDNNIDFLAQGTLYTDIIESSNTVKGNVPIKTHHNVGGIPEDMKIKLIEPICSLFKDEVRRIARVLKLDEKIIDRHPFPGPGLAIRIIGKVTKEKLEIVRKSDYILSQELKNNNLYYKIWQAFTVLLPVRTVGVMGDRRTYENVLSIRCINSSDGMTAEVFDFPYEILIGIGNKIINQVRGVNRVVYDISSKPPATIEWE